MAPCSLHEFPEKLPVLAQESWEGPERSGEVLGEGNLGFHRRIAVLGQDSTRSPGRPRSTAYFRQQNPDLNRVRYRDSASSSKVGLMRFRSSPVGETGTRMMSDARMAERIIPRSPGGVSAMTCS